MNAPTQRMTDTLRRTSTPLAALLLLLATAGPVAAQNNDDDGVLPGPQSFGTGTSGSQTAAMASTFAGLMLGQEPAGVVLDLGQSTVVVESEAVVIQAGSQDADLVPAPGQPLQGLFEPEEGRLSVQSDATLDLRAGIDARLEAATGYQHRISVLVLDDGVPLDQLLSGAAAPLAIHVVGDVAELDLRTFRRAVKHHGQALPGLKVTWVNGTIDAEGELHLMAVRVATEGGDLEIAQR